MEKPARLGSHIGDTRLFVYGRVFLAAVLLLLIPSVLFSKFIPRLYPPSPIGRAVHNYEYDLSMLKLFDNYMIQYD